MAGVYGAVVFDEKDKPLMGGWASVNGGDAFRIQSTGDLASDIKWWTNIGYEVFIANGGLQKPWLKRSDYFLTDMGQTIKELGLSPRFIQPARAVEILSEMFARVMRLAEEKYGIQSSVVPTLADELYSILLPEDRTISLEIDKASRQAFQSYVRCEQASPRGSQWVKFKRPRISHAIEVLSSPVPGQQWEFVDKSKLPKKDTLDWLVNHDQPVLAMVSVTQVNHNLAPVIAYGGGSRGDRGWMTHPELVLMSKFSRIRVDAVFLGGNYENLTPKKNLFAGGDIGPLSISVGFLAENYLRAMSMPKPFKAGQKTSVMDRLVPPRSSWLSATDRFHSLMSAIPLHNAGFRVMGYGNGSVSLAVPQGGFQEVVEAAKAAGLVGPISLSDDINIMRSLV